MKLSNNMKILILFLFLSVTCFSQIPNRDSAILKASETRNRAKQQHILDSISIDNDIYNRVSREIMIEVDEGNKYVTVFHMNNLTLNELKEKGYKVIYSNQTIPHWTIYWDY